VRKALALISFVFAMSVPTMAQTKQQPIRVKCGGSAYTDSKGQAWATDFDFSGGMVSQTTGPVSGTTDAPLFQGGRMPDDNSPLVYTFTVANGAYHVNLYFTELNKNDDFVGGRVFNVKTQGNVVLQNLDVFKTVGAGAALVKGVEVAVTNGQLKIELDNVAGHDRGKVTAIEITQNAPSPQLTLNFVHPDGTPVAGTLNYTMATSALKLGGNTPLTNGEATCVLFSDPAAMGLSGQIQLTLSLTDTAGHTLWQIGMTMDPTNVNFGAVQSSSLNVVVQKL
jgi:malectin (di-glucose binding ER protein)